MSDRLLALLTEKLIAKCGGLTEASAACAEVARPYSVTQLSRCQTVGSGCYLPLDIIAGLERYCGEPVISRALAERSTIEVSGARLADMACVFAEEASDVQRHLRQALADDRLSPREIKEGHRQIAEARAALDRTEAALAAADKAAG
jgi:hypothetical protein